jgi:hypothetical protein
VCSHREYWTESGRASVSMPRHTLMKENPIPEDQCLIECMVERDKMVKALNRVICA